MKVYVLIGSLLWLSCCTTAAELSVAVEEAVGENFLFDHGQVTRSQSWLLTPDTVFYLARNNRLTVLNSENSDVLTSLLFEAVSRHFSRTQVGMMPESYSLALQRAKMLGADFLIYPSINVWDSRVGGKPEKPQLSEAGGVPASESKFGLDRTEVQLMIVHSVTARVFDVVSIEAEAGFLTTLNNSPQAVLKPQLQTLFASLVANGR
ncbi:MAG: DUF4823 domain-containing protein [Pseudohongiellaceae bacterium]